MAGGNADAVGRPRPTRSQWEHHKSTIVRLYLIYPWREVDRLMSDRFGFSASKRMYDTRFRQWGVSKNLKRSEKNRLIALLQRRPEHEPEIEIDEKIKRKLDRHYKDSNRNKRKLDRQSTASNTGSPKKRDEIAQSVLAVSVSNPESRNSVMSLTPKTDVSEEPSKKILPVILSKEDSSSCTSSSPRPKVLTPPSATPRSDSSALEKPLSSTESLQLIPSPSMYKTQENVIFNVTSYYTSRLDRLGDEKAAFDVLTVGVTPESKQFWSNIKNGIYLWRIGAASTGFVDTYGRGCAALDMANQLASKALQTEPLNFICEMLSSLNPTRFEVFPPLRGQTLKYLADRAALLFGSAHPIRNLCQELQKDLPNAFISSKALFALSEVFRQKLGQEHPSIFRLKAIIITQMRRSHDPTEILKARKFAEGNAKLAELCHGRDSDIARSARVELAHILTKLGSHDRALSLRTEVVTKQHAHYDWEEPAGWRCDGISAHVMEDLAEYCVRFQDVPAAIEWLVRAKQIALRVWGEESFSTLHILDKLEKLERGDLDGQVVEKNL